MNKWNKMQAISALASIPFGSYRRTNVYLQKNEGLQFASYAITWHGIVHACKRINEFYACQASDRYLGQQASSSGSNFSRFGQLMDDKFEPLVTCIFRTETSAKRYTWDKQSIKYMHLKFSFFRISVITTRSRENHAFPGLCPRIHQQPKKENFGDFFPRNIWEISVRAAQFQVDSWKSPLQINLHWLPIQNTMTLYKSALKQSPALFLPQAFTCLNTIYGLNMGVIFRCTSELRPSAQFTIGSNAKLSLHFLHPQELWVSAKHIHV